MTISQELQNIIHMIRENAPDRELSIEEMRQGMEFMASLSSPSGDIECETLRVDGMNAEWISAPGSSADRVVLYLHGGGYVMGSINTHREMVSHISRATGARVLIIDYRLAPENPFPAAVEDAVKAFHWLLKEGFIPEQMVIAGDSAGGGLTVATLVALRDAGEQMPAAAVCLSPWVDLEALGESMTSKAEDDPVVNRADILRIANAYLGGSAPRSPLASPLFADLGGLPPMLIQVGTAEVLLDDSARLTKKAREAGVDISYEPWEGMIHVWQYHAATVPEAKKAVERIGQFVKEHTP
jgi:acetyl esterase/lipase